MDEEDFSSSDSSLSAESVSSSGESEDESISMSSSTFEDWENDSSNVSSSIGESEEDYSNSSEESEEENSNVSLTSKELTIPNVDGVDRFTALPDALLHHILSFLDMKRVVLTSLVSRRFQHLWKSMPCLNLKHYKWRKQKKVNGEYLKVRFMNFVDHVLESHDESSIQHFHLSCDSYCNADRIDKWVVDATTRHAQEVFLEIDYNEPDQVLPEIIFTANIGVFKLKSIGSVQLPGSISLASQLKILQLDFAILPEGDSNGHFVLCCPILEDLSLRNCNHEHLKILKVSSPMLKNLVVENKSYSLNHRCKIEISTPNLTSLQLKGRLYRDYSLQNLYSLVNAKLDSHDEAMSAQTLIDIIGGLSNATSVELCCFSVKNLKKFPDGSDQLLSPFSNLRCLKFIGWSNKVPCIPAIKKLLKSSPCLETLGLGVNQVVKSEDWGELLECISHLKSVDLRGIKGCEMELSFFGFLLKNATVLEELTAVTEKISPCREEGMINFSKKIHSLPRASPSVRIIFLLKSFS